MKKGTIWSWKSLTDHCNSTSRRHFQVYSGGILKWTGGGGLTYQFLLGVWGKRISFLSQINMMLRAGMNNFMAVGFHTLTNRMKSHCHEMFISTFFGGKIATTALSLCWYRWGITTSYCCWSSICFPNRLLWKQALQYLPFCWFGL